MIAKSKTGILKLRKACRDPLDMIENYDKAISSDDIWDLHHRLELTLDGEYAMSKEDLIRHCMYYDRPYFELIFLPHGVHSSMHMKAFPKDSVQYKKFLTSAHEALRGKTSWNKGLRTGKPAWNHGMELTPEWKQKIGDKHRGSKLSMEHRKKISDGLRRHLDQK